MPAERGSDLAHAQNRMTRQWSRVRAVRITTTVINMVCGLFAAVLAAHIVMVIGEANPANGVASFVRGFAAAVSLGFDDLFTPDSPKARILFNYGLAALLWLALGALITTLIRRFARRGPD
ncbi:hypothetical protein EV193_11963 [Herbihabitans rhizosphaerae]|uniref:Uncharacterized protein n=2 Tax=Herbihabitans rhizosphaerae TaxID=1872711 RepID=A0A4Q7KDJ1_9PSEU|nr:hypothetical protein EV193_11963 [Herbihabitans rhizosphaerae]